MLRWFRRGTRRAAAEPEAALFDVSLDFDPAALGGITAEQVRAAAEAVPGAGWVSVEPHRGAGLELRLFAAGSGVEAGEAGAEVKRRIEAAVRGLLARPDPPALEGSWAAPAAMAGGFAESAAQFEALAQLSALAATQQSALPPATPPPARSRRKRTEPAFPAPRSLPPQEAPAVAEADTFRLGRLLALVLPADPAEVAEAAVRRFGSFAAVLAAPEAELRRVPGLGTHCIAAVKLIHAAAIRHSRAGLAGRPVLDDPQRLADYLAAALARERIEQFRILFLDADGLLQADEVQARGTVNHTPVYPREVVRRALALRAAAVVLVHNHPSGDPAPSGEDIAMTRQVQQAAAVLGIGLRDHIIVGNGRWLSFRAEGLLS